MLGSGRGVVEAGVDEEVGADGVSGKWEAVGQRRQGLEEKVDEVGVAVGLLVDEAGWSSVSELDDRKEVDGELLGTARSQLLRLLCG